MDSKLRGMAFIHRIREFIQKDETKTHIVGWGLFFISDILFTFGMGGRSFGGNYFKNVLFILIYFYSLLFISILPNLPKKKLKAVIMCIVILSSLILIKYLIDSILDPFNAFLKLSLPTYITHELWRFSTITFYAYAYWIYIGSMQEQKLRRATEAKLLKSEIDFLKAQINPHFLFNTLNFIYNDVSNVSTRSGEAIMSLTKMMRYSVESTTTEKTSLSKETEGIEEYLKLQRLRFGENLMLSYVKSGNFMLYAFPPLVLLSIIENAFKYGVIDDAQSPIDITLSVNQNRLSFKCRNKKRMDFIDKETTAVGLANIKKRLEMAYSTHFDLRIHDDTETYEVWLIVNWIKE